MKYSFLAMLFIAFSTQAQTTSSDSLSKKEKNNISISIGSNEERDSTSKNLDIHIGIFDIGINSLRDKTDYTNAATQAFLNVPQDLKNKNLHSLKIAKSVNVNIYPIAVKYRMVKSKAQRLYASVGLGLQIYNFRFSKPISYQNETIPAIILDSIPFSKNKIAITYLSMPFMLTAKSRLAENIWLVYGLGLNGGFCINVMQKQISDERGKQKNRDQFNFNNFNACVTGELGVDGYVRLFASYQLTPLHENALLQYPYTIGIRFFGI